MGIDPGYAILGYGIVDMKNSQFHMIDYGTITTEAKEVMAIRLQHIYEELIKLIDLYQPDAVALEELFFNKNVKTAIMVAQARGVATVACVNKGLTPYEYTPLQIKQALVGYGRADKKQMQFMVKYILSLQETPQPDDAADALATAICHGNAGTDQRKLRIRNGI